ncbi:MAG: AAA family ATPase, partial [Myxococcota bacterium]
GLLRDTIRYLSKEAQPVLLVDEYDAPLVDHIRGSNAQEWNHNLQVAEANRQILKDFYSVLKAQGGNLRFLMVTGVSKVAHVSVFSGLSNLNDITLHPQYDMLLGYTQQELESYFSPYILDYPNLEVREAFTESLLQDYAHTAQGKTINDQHHAGRAGAAGNGLGER